MKFDLEYVVSLFGDQRTYQRALLVALQQLQSIRHYFQSLRATILAGPRVPLSFLEYVQKRFAYANFLVVNEHLETFLGKVPALWRYTYAFDFPEPLNDRLVRVVCDVDSWPCNLVWNYVLSNSRKSHFWGTAPQVNRFTYVHIKEPVTFSVDCGVAVIKASIPGARAAVLEILRDEDEQKLDYSKPTCEYSRSGKDALQLSRCKVMFGRDEAVLHRVLWERFSRDAQLVYHNVESRVQAGRTMEIILAQPEDELPGLEKVLTRSGHNEIRYGYPVYHPRPLSELEWSLVKRLEGRVSQVSTRHSDTVQGCNILHFAVNGVALAPQLSPDELEHLRVGGSWFELARNSLMCCEPKLIGVELHYRTRRQSDGKWHTDHGGSLFNWLNVVVPLNSEYDESLGCTQVRAGSSTLTLGQCPPRHWYAFDAQLVHRASRNSSTFPKTTLFLTFSRPELAAADSPAYNKLLRQVEPFPTRSQRKRSLE